jgi:hypothetical protein
MGNGSPARCASLPKPRISACSTFNSPKPTDRLFKLPLQLGELPIEPAEERLSSLRVASIAALRRRSSSSNRE